MKRTKSHYIWLPLVIALSVIVGIVIGNFYAFYGKPSGGQWDNKLATIFGYIGETYVDSIDTEQLMEESIPLIIDQLDPHSAYIPAEDLEAVNEDLEGHFSGIGVQFSILHDTVTVISVVSGGPSAAAGILNGDRIVMVNDSLFVGKSINNERVLKQLRGPKGSVIKLGIRRANKPKLLTMSVKRDDISVNTVDAFFEVEKGIGYVKINKFGATTYNEFITALSEFKQKQVKTLMVDLRQNAGGYMQAAQAMLNEFFGNKQLIVYTEGRMFPRMDYYSNGSGTFQQEQVVVLVDEGSASASEIFAGAMQDTDRGLVVGRRTFGKGLVQQQFELNDGSALRLTVARYYTPSGRCIQKEYTMGEQENYRKDLLNRFLGGEMDNQDSVKHNSKVATFKTVAGRTIHGNDGIMPDVFVPRDTVGLNSYYIQVVGDRHAYEYAMEYIDRNRQKLNSFKTWQAMVAHLQQQSLVDGLADYAYTKGIRKRPYLINESRKHIEKYLIGDILRPFFGESAYFQFVLQYDPTYQKALSLIKAGKTSPQAVARQAYK